MAYGQWVIGMLVAPDAWNGRRTNHLAFDLAEIAYADASAMLKKGRTSNG
jgi:hypothetical protein